MARAQTYKTPVPGRGLPQLPVVPIANPKTGRLPSLNIPIAPVTPAVVPTFSGGGGVFGGAGAAVARRQAQQTNYPDLIRAGLSPEGAQSALQLLSTSGKYYERPSSFLDKVFRALRVFENVGAGIFLGATRYFDEYEGSFNIPGLGNIGPPPWAWIAAAGKGFSEVPDAIGRDLSFAEYIKETQDPGSFAYKHANLTGLGLSIIFDPLMYVSFGATAPSKLRAARLWAEEIRKTGEATDSAYRAGRFGPDVPWGEAQGTIHLERGAPFSMGDALTAIRNQDLAGEFGRFRQAFPRGGKGTRFAGMEIPGTAKVGEEIGVWARRHLKESSPAHLGRRLFIPGGALGLIADDMRRTLAVVEFRTFLDEQGFIAEKLSEAVKSKLIRVTDPEARVALGLLGEETAAIPRAIRIASAKGESVGAYEVAIQAMNRQVNLTRGRITTKARSKGMDESFMAEMDELWKVLNRSGRDPVDVVADFSMRAEARILKEQQIRRALENPIFSLELRGAAEAEKVVALEAKVESAWERMTAAQAKLDSVARKPMKQRSIYMAARKKAEAHYKALVNELDEARLVRLEKGAPSPRSAKTTAEAAGLFSRYTRKRLPQGVVPFKFQGKEYAVAEEIAEALDKLRNPMFLDKELSEIFRLMNWVQNKWKILATLPNPAFHVMNSLGAIWNATVLGGVNPVNYKRAVASLMLRSAEAAEEAGRLAPVRRRVLSGADEARVAGAKETHEAFLKRGGGGRGTFVAAELTKPPTEIFQPGFRGRFLRPGSETSTRRFTARRVRQAIGVSGAAALVAEEGFGVDIPGASPWETILLIPEAASAGRVVASAIEDTVRLAPFEAAKREITMRERQNLQIIEAYGGPRIPNFDREVAAKLFRKRDREALYDVAAEMTRRYQFDYSDLTDFERVFAKTVFPFYTYYRKNFTVQLKELIKAPRTLDAVSKMENYISEEGKDLGTMAMILPEYFSQLNAFQIPVPNAVRGFLGLPQDQPLYLNPKLPFVSLNLFPAFWNMFANTATPTPQKWGEMLRPIMSSVGPFAVVPGAKIMFEYWTGVQLGLNRPIDYQRAQSGDWRNSTVTAPGWFKYLPGVMKHSLGFKDPDTGAWKMSASANYILEQISSPFLSNAGRAIPIGGEDPAKARANLVSWMTGVRLLPVDLLKIQRGFGYRLENMLESRKLELKERGEFMDPEDDYALRMIRAQLKSIEYMWDIREKELYG